MAPHDTVSTNPADYRCRAPVPLRFRDLDAMGHVNNAVFFTFFEIGRGEYLHAIGFEEASGGDLGARYPFILANISCQFLAPVTLDLRPEVCVRSTRIGSKSWTFEYLLAAQDRTPLATGTSTQVYFDYAAQQSRALPDAVVARLEAYEGRALR